MASALALAMPLLLSGSAPMSSFMIEAPFAFQFTKL
jgi:hypothetical protein